MMHRPAYSWAALRPATPWPQTLCSQQHQALIWAEQHVQLARSLSGAGAGAALEVCATSGRRTSGRPERWLVTMGGEPGSSVSFATNSNAISAKPATAKKARAGIAAF